MGIKQGRLKTFQTALFYLSKRYRFCIILAAIISFSASRDWQAPVLQ
jgi:hypothetical protein